MVFLCVDESPWSINDGGCATVANPNSRVWVDFPASFHAGSCGFSFCDGHAELHRWVGGAVQITKAPTGQVAVPNNPADNKDFNWMAQHTSARK
jgi:prepilin-type processing-associated H-X9-DG protein